MCFSGRTRTPLASFTVYRTEFGAASGKLERLTATQTNVSALGRLFVCRPFLPGYEADHFLFVVSRVAMLGLRQISTLKLFVASRVS